MTARENGNDLLEPSDGAAAASSSSRAVGDVLGGVSVLSRLAWFAFGAAVATTITALVLLKPWHRPRTNESALPFETFPFADNAGVCQEWVAVANVQTSHADAVATVRRIAASLPGGIHAENLRVVRALAAGDYWTVAVDTQSGSGDEARARAVADEMNGIPGTGLRFAAVFYSSRQLYDTAHVLCMPRQTPAP
jgi:hypothetical protein